MEIALKVTKRRVEYSDLFSSVNIEGMVLWSHHILQAL